MAASILLVDDHPIFLKGLCALLEDEADMSVVGEAGDGRTALKMTQQLSPDVVVMDITMPGLSGIETTQKIISDHPGIKIIALSIHSGKEFVEGMLKAGAIGYIVKESVPEELVKGIRVVMGGEAYLSPCITGLIVSQFRKSPQDLLPQTEEFDIIETKLHAPAVSKDHVHRPRLVEILENNRHLSIQNIIAPAGYGKSMLVTSWLKKQDWPYIWLSVDHHDHDLRQFVTYFLTAVTALFPGTMKKSIELLHAEKSPQIQQLAGRLATELNLIEQDFIMVLDDLHLIRGKKVHDLISEVFYHPPTPFHLIIIGRMDPFLPIAKLRAQGHLKEIRTRDLKFTYEETETFVNQMAKKSVENHLIQALWDKTEGWITGIRLAALSIRHQSDFNTILSKLNDSPEYVMEYLFSEVLSSQPQQVRDCLMRTAILNQFCTPLCRAVLSDASNTEPGKDEFSSQEFISLLKKENMFIIKLDTDNGWYRYHHLFQTLLKNELVAKMSIEKISSLHARASRWLDEHGFAGEAIEHALTAGDTDVTVQIIEKNRISIIDQDTPHILKDGLKNIPLRIKKTRPDLLLGMAWVLFEQMSISGISPIIDQVERLVDKEPSDPVRLSEISFFKGLIHYFQGNSRQSVDYFIQSAELLPQKTFIALRAESESWVSMALHLNGQKETATQRLHDTIQKRGELEGIVLSRLAFALCFIHMLDGEFLQAVQVSLRMKDVCRVNNLTLAGTWPQFIQGNAALQMFDLEEAQQNFQHVVENRYITSPKMALDAMAGLAITRQLMGMPDNEVDEIVSMALAYAEWSTTPSFLEIIRSWQARIALLRGDLESAEHWQRSLNKISGDLMMIFFLEIQVITECRVLVAGQSAIDLKKAVNKLDTLNRKTLDWNNTYQRLQIMTIQAVAKYHLGHTEVALGILEEALPLAVPGNWILPFVELGQPMAEMIKTVKPKNIADNSVSKILAAFDIYGHRYSSPASGATASPENAVPCATVQPLIDELTNREMEILILLAQHLYNKEIAEKLFISTETVKTHLKRIYEKLDVGSRRNAVIKAREIGLITDR